MWDQGHEAEVAILLVLYKWQEYLLFVQDAQRVGRIQEDVLTRDGEG